MEVEKRIWSYTMALAKQASIQAGPGDLKLDPENGKP